MVANKLGYSETDLLKDLREWWNDEIAASDDPFALPKPPSGTIYEVQPAADSLAVVRRLAIIDTHVGFEISPTVVRRGGYRSFDDMIQDLLPKVRTLYLKRQKSKEAVA